MTTLHLPDAGTLADLVTYLGRAQRVDPRGAVRLVASGQVLAAYVSPVHGGGGPTVIGLRVASLVEPVEIDTTVALAAMADRFARRQGLPSVEVPPTQVTDAAWAGMSPPRSGWQVVGAVDHVLLADVARRGADEVTAGTPDDAGGPAVARLRALVWGRDLPGVAGVPAGAAWVAQALGFTGLDDPVTLYAAGAWRRLTTVRGHVLSRTSLL